MRLPKEMNRSHLNPHSSILPHDTSAAIHYGAVFRCLRWPWQALVMNTFEAVSGSTVVAMDGRKIGNKLIS